MAVLAKATKATTSRRKTVAELTEENSKLKAEIDKLKDGAWCYMCDKHKARDKFYVSTDPLIKSMLAPICKECARKLALKIGGDGKEHTPDQDSVKTALKYLNKPFLEKVWTASIQESENLIAGKAKYNAWTAYAKNIAMVNYVGKTYFDSDIYAVASDLAHEPSEVEVAETNADIIEAFEQNKKDSIRLLGYDPFVNENTSDQPFLYSNLIGYLDASEDANEDRMKLSSIIEIVKGFNHVEKINDIVAKLMMDFANIEKNIATIKNLEETKNKIISSILNLAKDNGISLKHSVNSSKGENTWTGKVRKMKEMNLRDQEVNLYDSRRGLP